MEKIMKAGGINLNEKGFTLIEVMISMMLVGVIAMAFIPLLASQYVNVYKSGDKSEATYDALEKVEDKMADPKTKKYDETKDDVDEDNVITFGTKTIINDIKEVEVKGESTKKKNGAAYQETTLKVGVPIDKIEKKNPAKP